MTLRKSATPKIDPECLYGLSYRTNQLFDPPLVEWGGELGVSKFLAVETDSQ